VFGFSIFLGYHAIMTNLQNHDTFDKENFKNKVFEQVETSTCFRKHRRVGCIAVKDGKIIANSYNGAAGKIPPCASRGYCLRNKLGIESGIKLEISYCVCAEQRMISQAMKDGISLEGADVYVNITPCPVCTKLLIECGVNRIFYYENYSDGKLQRELCELAGVELTKLG